MASPAPPLADSKKPATPPPDTEGKRGGDKAAAGNGAGSAVKGAAAGAPAAEGKAGQAKDSGAQTAGQGKTASGAGAAQAAASQQRFDRMAVRAKLAVSEPGDAVEREADAVADKVMRMTEPPAADKTAGNKTAGNTAATGQTAALANGPAKADQVQRKEEPGTKPSPVGKPSGATAKTAGDNTTKTNKPQQAAGTGPQAAAGAPASASATPGAGKGGEEIRRKAAEAAPSATNDAADPPASTQALIEGLGAGEPLDAELRALFETRMGADFSHVRIHTDAAAARSARQIGARAFTYGSHIAFAAGAYQPGSESGRRLLAHELTHVLQQSAGTISRKIMRKPASGATGGGDEFEVSHAELEVPPIKARHVGGYGTLAGKSQLKRKGAYDASTRGTKQVGLWTGGVKADVNKIPEAQRPSTSAGFNLNLNVAGGASAKVIKAGSLEELRRLLQIPTWDGSGKDVQFQVDHMVEYQLGGADDLANMELLNQAHNGSVGSSFSHGIKRTVREEIQKDPKKAALKDYAGPTNAAGDPTAEGVMEAMTIVFRKVKGRARESKRKEGGSMFWAREQIEALDHVLGLLGSGGSLEGTATSFALLSPTGNLLIGHFAHGASQNKIAVGANQAGGMAGFKLKQIVLNAGYNDTAAGTNIGSIEGVLDFGPAVAVPKENVSVGITQAASPGKYSGRLGASAGAGLPNEVDFKPMSPMALTGITFGKGVFGQATLKPTHPVLSGISIPATIENGRLGLFHTIDATALAGKLKIPGVGIDAAAITLGYDGAEFSVAGSAEFTIRKFGTGYLNARADTGRDFELEGGLRADKRLFDQADMKLWYRKKGGFGGSGTLAITQPGKIKGLKSARLSAKYEDSVFSASGEVMPDIPGLKAATLSVTYANDQLEISGTLAIDNKVPGVEKADIKVTVTQTDTAWKVAASGDVTPKLPGLSGAKLKFSYDDGFVLMEGEFDINKGPISGSFKAGVTNGTVDDKGVRGEGGSGATFKVFGAADVDAVFLKDKLSGKLKLRLLPDGSIRVGGGLTVADFEVFPQIPKGGGEFLNIPITSPRIPLPGAGFSVGQMSVGVTFWASGYVKAHAAVGPGRMTGITLTITEFDPAAANLETLEVGGKAKFVVDGAAGVKVGADINVGLSAVVVDLVGSLGVSGEVGIPEKTPVLTAATGFTYSKAKGLDIGATCNLDISPSLTFKLKGGFAAKLNLYVDTVTLWRKDWTLAEANFKLPIGITANGALNYNSKTDKLDVDPKSAIKVKTPEFKSDEFKRILDGSPSAQDVRTVDAETNKAIDEDQLMCMEPEPEPNFSEMPPAESNASVMPKRDETAAKDTRSTPPVGVSEQDIRALGNGLPLPDEQRRFFEGRLDQPLDAVRIYSNPEADLLAARLAARAFTFGNAIVFAKGEYRPDTTAGQALLAHELAHVMQQNGGVARRIMRLPTPPGGSSSTTPATTGAGTPAAAETPAQRSARARRELEQFVVPASKRRHGHVYQQWLASGKLRHGPNYDREADPPAQIGNWEGRLSGFETRAVWSRHYERLGVSAEAAGPQTITFSGGRIESHTFSEWVGYFKRPQWNHAGQWMNHRLEVDHIVELQTASWPVAREADEVENYELLDKSTNASAGGTIYTGLRQKMRALLAAERDVRPEQVPLRPGAGGTGTDAETELRSRGVEFSALAGGSVGDGRGGGRRGDAAGEFWVLAELQAGEHLAAIQAPAATSGGGSGAADRFLLLSAASNGSEIAPIPTRTGLNAEVSGSASRRLASMRIQRVRFDDAGYGTAAGGANIGHLDATWQLPAGIMPASPDVSFTIGKAQDGQYNGYLVAPTEIAAESSALSPIRFTDISFDAQGINATGSLTPSIPLLGEQGIAVSWTHGDIRFGRSFSADDLQFAVPGVTLDAASLSVFYDRNGFGAEGGLYFTLAHLGTGALTAAVDGAGRFCAEGRLDLDTRVFDEADVRVWYRDGAFGGGGRVAITRPGRIRGVNAASIEVSADSQHISASGNLQPALPGVQNAALNANYSADEGLVVGGDLQLAEIAGIREGAVHAELRKRDGDWRVSASGRATPALPGINSEITLVYDDGAFDGRLTADYAQGIMSGSVTLGLTNRPVNEDGELAGGDAPGSGGDAAPPPAAGEGLSIYGSGTVTARLTDWLQGGVGLKIRPRGDILISGQIGIPEPVTVFDQYPPPERAQRTLFAMPTVSIPLVGLSVGSTVVGVALTINGRVTGHAHIGPGRLTQTELRIEDFNPAQPESLHVTGDAEFNLPAEAGVGAALDAGVSLGAAVINATAGINVSAEAAVHADVTPHVDLDWRPDAGLHLHADLNASLSPRLAFDLNGYAEVTANALVTTFSLWRKEWNLARREVGSSLALGLQVPVDYYSDSRGVVFNPEDVRFEVPALNADTLDQLLNAEPGGSEHVEHGRADAARAPA